MSSAVINVWNDDDCRRIHEATLTLVEKTGVEVNYQPALDAFAAAGARVDGSRVRVDRGLVEKALESAPRTWEVRSRGRDEVIELKDGNSYFGTGSDCIYIRDPESGERRRITNADIEGLAAVSEVLPHIDFVMSMGLPGDVAQEVDDVSAVAAMLRGTRKPLMVAPRNGFVMKHIKEMCAAAGEADSLMIYAMPAPPLQLDKDGLTKVIACAELNVPIAYASAPNAGTTGPRTHGRLDRRRQRRAARGAGPPPACEPRGAVDRRHRRRRHGHARP